MRMAIFYHFWWSFCFSFNLSTLKSLANFYRGDFRKFFHFLLMKGENQQKYVDDLKIEIWQFLKNREGERYIYSAF